MIASLGDAHCQPRCRAHQTLRLLEQCSVESHWEKTVFVARLESAPTSRMGGAGHGRQPQRGRVRQGVQCSALPIHSSRSELLQHVAMPIQADAAGVGIYRRPASLTTDRGQGEGDRRSRPTSYRAVGRWLTGASRLKHAIAEPLTSSATERDITHARLRSQARSDAP